MRDRDSLILESLYHTILENNGMDAKYAELERRAKDGDESAKEEALQLIYSEISRKIPKIPRITGFDIRGKYVEVIKNASKRERKDLESDDFVGEILLPNNDTLSFNRMLSLHQEIISKMNLPKRFLITGLLYRDGFLITDATGSFFKQNPIAILKVEKKYKVPALTYDESIVGDWKNIETDMENIFTYDDNGKIIPLSQRFDSSKDDIRF